MFLSTQGIKIILFKNSYTQLPKRVSGRQRLTPYPKVSLRECEAEMDKWEMIVHFVKFIILLKFFGFTEKNAS